MFNNMLEFFNQRPGGEQALMLIAGGILVFLAGTGVGRLAHFIFGG